MPIWTGVVALLTVALIQCRTAPPPVVRGARQELAAPEAGPMEDSLRGGLVYRIVKGSLVLMHGTGDAKLVDRIETVAEPSDFDNTYLVRRDVVKGSLPAAVTRLSKQNFRLLVPDVSTCTLTLGKVAAYGWAVPPEGVELDTRTWVALSPYKQAQIAFHEGTQFLATEVKGRCGNSVWAAPWPTKGPEPQFQRAETETSAYLDVALRSVRGSPTFDRLQRSFVTLKTNVLQVGHGVHTKPLPSDWLDLEGTNRFWLISSNQTPTILVGSFERSTRADQLPPRTGDDPRFWFNPRMLAIWKITRDVPASLTFLGPQEPILEDGEQFSLAGGVSAFKGMPLLLFDTENRYGALRFARDNYTLDSELTFGPAQLQAPNHR